MRKPLISIINGKNLNRAGGYQTYTLALSKKLEKEGYEVKIFSLGKRVDISGIIFYAPILAYNIFKKIRHEQDIILYGIGPWTLAGALCKTFLFYKKIKLLSYYPTTFKHEYKATVDATVFSDYGVFLWLKARIVNLTIIPVYSLLESFALWQTDEVIIHHKSAKQILTRQFGLHSNKIKISPQIYGSYISYRQSLVSKKTNIVVSISRQDARKGINFLLHALKVLDERGVKYSAIIAGSGEMLKHNKKLARRLMLKDVAFPGFVKDKRKLLAKNPIFVLPSLEEGSGSIAILEAMQSGLRIVATKVDGISEDLGKYKLATLISPKNPKALADAIEKFIFSS